MEQLAARHPHDPLTTPAQGHPAQARGPESVTTLVAGIHVESSTQAWSVKPRIAGSPVDISFAPLEREDLPMLARWLRTPHVQQWWPDPSDLASVTAKYLPLIEGTDRTEGFLINVDDLPIGFIQSYRFADEPEWSNVVAAAIEVRDAAGIDYLIGRKESTGRGLGSAALRSFVGALWHRHEEIATVVVAVQQANAPSWKALERAGVHRAWSGLLDTDDPSDQGPAYLYVIER
jgi:aminoglycoside 6'-N-acetyltransferase